MADAQPHWSRIGEVGTLAGLRFLVLVYRLAGRAGFRVVLFPVMVYFYLFRHQARSASRQYLRRIRPLLPAGQGARLTSFRHFVSFGEILLDKLLVWIGRIRREDVLFETPDSMRDLRLGQGGGILVVSHLGNLEICNALSQQVPGISLTILVYTQHAQKFNTMLRELSGDTGVEIMQVTDLSPATVMLFAERVRAGGYVVIAGDRTPVSGQQRVSNVEFLGGVAPFPQGPFILAGLLGCPVYFLFCLKRRRQYHVYLEKYCERLRIHPRRRRTQILDGAVQDFADRLQHYCLQAPLQWFNFYAFWRDGRAAETGAQP